MISIFNTFLIFILQGVLALSFSSTHISKVDIGDHIQQFESFNRTHHDNIDDDFVPHNHTHKHSKDGKEHEHKHEHTKVTQFEVLKFHTISSSEIAFELSYYNKQTFSSTIYLSTKHTLEIFRPPIV